MQRARHRRLVLVALTALACAPSGPGTPAEPTTAGADTPASPSALTSSFGGVTVAPATGFDFVRLNDPRPFTGTRATVTLNGDRRVSTVELLADDGARLTLQFRAPFAVDTLPLGSTIPARGTFTFTEQVPGARRGLLRTWRGDSMTVRYQWDGRCWHASAWVNLRTPPAGVNATAFSGRFTARMPNGALGPSGACAIPLAPPSADFLVTQPRTFSVGNRVSSALGAALPTGATTTLVLGDTTAASGLALVATGVPAGGMHALPRAGMAVRVREHGTWRTATGGRLEQWPSDDVPYAVRCRRGSGQLTVPRPSGGPLAFTFTFSVPLPGVTMCRVAG